MPRSSPAFSGLGGDAYSDQWTGTSSGTGVAFDYDGERFHHESLVPAQLVAWQTTLDDSCMAAHAADRVVARHLLPDD